MKKLIFVIIIAAVILIAIDFSKKYNIDLSDNDINSSENLVNETQNNQENKLPDNLTTDKELGNDIMEENTVVEDNNIETDNNIESENNVQTEPGNKVPDNVEDVVDESNKEPDNSYVGEEENSKDDYDTELDGQNKAIVLVKQYLGDKASNYTFNVETITSSAYVVRAMDENSSNTYYSVNFTTWVVSEI